MTFKSIHITADGKISFFFYGWVAFHCVCVCMCVCVCVCITSYLLSIDGKLGCFHILEIVNNAPLDIRVQVSFQISVFATEQIKKENDMFGFSLQIVLHKENF